MWIFKIFLFCALICCSSSFPITSKAFPENSGVYINEKYQESTPIGTLYGITFDLISFNYNVYLSTIDYLSGKRKQLVAFPSRSNFGPSVYYNIACDVEHNRIFFSDVINESVTVLKTVDLQTLEVTSAPSANEAILGTHFPANGTIYSLGSENDPTIRAINTITNERITLASTPENVLWKDSPIRVIPSFNNNTNSLIFSGFYVSWPTNGYGPALETLYSLDVTNGKLNNSLCSSELLATGVWYDPKTDLLFVAGKSVPSNETDHPWISKLRPGNIEILTVDPVTCEKANYFNIPNTVEVNSWNQLFTFDPYTGYLFMNVFYKSGNSTIITIDLRNKELVSSVNIVGYALFSPFQFIPFQ